MHAAYTMTIQFKTAQAIGIARPTSERHWALFRASLFGQLHAGKARKYCEHAGRQITHYRVKACRGVRS